MEEDNNNYNRVKQALDATGLFDEYFEKFKQHQMDDEIMIQLIQDVDLSQNLQRLIPVLGHEMKFKMEFKRLCGDEIPIKLPLYPYLQQEMMDFEYIRPDIHLTKRRGRGRAKTTPMSVDMKAKTSRKPPKDRTTKKFNSNGSLNTGKRRGRPPKIWPALIPSSSSTGNMNGHASTSFEVNNSEEEDVEHGDMNDGHSYSPGPGPNGGTASTSPPIKKPRGRPSLKKNKPVINSIYQSISTVSQQDEYDDSTSPTKSQQQQQESLKVQNSSENPFKRPRGRPPNSKQKPNSKQFTAKKQSNKERTQRLIERNTTEVGIKYELNDGYPFENEEFEEMPILSSSHESAPLVDNSSKISVAVNSTPVVHSRKQIFILKSECENLTESLGD